MHDSCTILIFGAIIPMPITPIKVQNVTAITSPPVKFLPLLELYSFCIRVRPYNNAINIVEFKKNIIKPIQNPSFLIVFNSI